VALEHELVISHGNGPQVGLLALQASAFDEVSPYPFDVLGAQTEGMIGYLIEQELGNLLPFEKPLATILTMTEVDPADPAFDDPTKFVDPVYGQDEAHRLAAERGWVVKPDGDTWRRVVPSPVPLRIFEQRPVEWLLARGCVVVCAGGGGIPTMYRPGTQTLVGRAHRRGVGAGAHQQSQGLGKAGRRILFRRQQSTAINQCLSAHSELPQPFGRHQ
jgi:carbamate kinase